MKKWLCKIMVIVFLSITISSSYCQTIYAFSEDNKARQDLEAIVRGIFAFQGKAYDDTIFEDMFDAWFPVNQYSGVSMDDLLPSFDELYMMSTGSETSAISKGITVGADGLVTVSEEAAEQILELEQVYLRDNAPDVMYLPVYSSDEIDSTFFYDTQSYYRYRSWTDEVALSLVSPQCWTVWSGNYCNKYLAVADYTNMYLVAYNPSSTWSDKYNAISYLTSVTNSDGFVSAGNITLDYVPFDSNGVFVDKGLLNYDHTYCYYQYSDTSPVEENFSYYCGNRSPGKYYANALLCNPLYFKYSASNYSGYDISISGFLVRGSNSGATFGFYPLFKDANALKTWLTGESGYYYFESQYNGGAITLDPNFDYGEVYEQVSTALAESVQNGETLVSLLSAMQNSYNITIGNIQDSLDDISENTGTTNSWLEKIYDKLCDIYNALVGVLVVDTAGTAWDIFTDIYNGLFDFVEEKFEILEIVQEASQLGDVIKHKFPFSIPWDIYAILLLFDAPAKPPVFSFHFEIPSIDYVYDLEYSMDSDEWARAAKLCRMFALISYEIGLLHLTQKLYASGLFEPYSTSRKK